MENEYDFGEHFDPAKLLPFSHEIEQIDGVKRGPNVIQLGKAFVGTDPLLYGNDSKLF